MDASIRSRSAILAIAFHLALFLILLFTFMTTRIPPFPEAGGGGGVLVNIGTLEEASGDVQPMSENATKEPVAEKIKPQQAEEEIATQETEEAPVIQEKKKEIKKVTPDKNVATTVVTKPVEITRTADSKSLYKGKSNASTSQGTGVGKGDQGDPAGDPFSKYTGKNGNGIGGVGNGTGEGPGTGPGKGGVSFSLDGRRMIRVPSISDHSQETGKVVVDITVDKDGSVASAIPGGRGSTTTSAYLFRLAKEAAMRAKFNSSEEEADIQKGTITFVFLVQ